jgi:arginyl-tRNA synthetase
LKSNIAHLVEQALALMPELANAPEASVISRSVERTRDARHGDFTTNIAMRLAKSIGRNPRELAAQIIEHLPASEFVNKVEIAGPGFINFHVSSAAFHQEIASILEDGDNYGRQEAKEKPRYLLEFVSANPTGPLHVGHG